MKKVFVARTVELPACMFPVIRPGCFKFFKKLSPGLAWPPEIKERHDDH